MSAARVVIAVIIVLILAGIVTVIMYNLKKNNKSMKNETFVDKHMYRPDYNYHYVIYFSSKSCGHCAQVQPIWDQILRQFPQDDTGIIFKQVIYEDNPEPVKYFGIEAFPAIVGIRGGKIRTTFSGARTFENVFRFVVMFHTNY